MKTVHLLVYCLIVTGPIIGQELLPLGLSDMSSFKAQAGNWKIVGDVSMDRTKDVHEHGNEGVKTTSGTGVLVNMNNDTQKDALLTDWEHGDMVLELEFMLPKGSNSGIYLQGRYEVQLYDSWGSKEPKFSDLGGIYRNWEREEGKVYMGKAPLINAAKAPGLWQKMHIDFQAPRFDAAGKKIKNALLKKVTINGMVIHQNIEIPLPTGGPLVNNEVPMGPLMIQGDHGAVAFRNIKYRKFLLEQAKVSNVTYKYWKGSYQYEADFKSKTANKTGSSPDGLTWEVAEVKDYFALQLNGDLEIPIDDEYQLRAIVNSNVAIYIDGKEILKNKKAWNWDYNPSEKITLTKGKHALEVYIARADIWLDPTLGLFIKSTQIDEHPIHALSSYFVKGAVSPIKVTVGKKPEILRAFLDFKGVRNLRRTHTVGVGDPTGMHYVYDNAVGAISCMWRGEFVDATPMWNDRGDGSFKPLGDPIYLDNEPQIYIKDSTLAPVLFQNYNLPTTVKSEGYTILTGSKTPVFHYVVGGMKIEDATYPDAASGGLLRTLKFDKTVNNTEMRLASGTSIEKVNATTYKIDGNYYLETWQDARIEKHGTKQILVASPNNNEIRYSLIW